MDSNSEEYKYIKAKSKVGKLKSFYRHITIYVISIIVLILARVILKNTEETSVLYAIFDYSADVTVIIWGFAVVLHAFLAFGLDKILGKNWEAKKITEYIDEDHKTGEK